MKRLTIALLCLLPATSAQAVTSAQCQRMINAAEAVRIQVQIFGLKQHGVWGDEIIITETKPNIVPEPFNSSAAIAFDGARLFDAYIADMKAHCDLD